MAEINLETKLVGDIKVAIETCIGKEMITNRELSDEEKKMLADIKAN